MATTQQQLDAIKSAINEGARSVTYDGNNTVEYRSLSEMRSIQAGLEDELSGTEKTDSEKAFFPTYGRGF